MHASKNGKNGFSLVEVLVSIVVLAIGVIGAAGMQLSAMRSNQQAAYHTQALQLATEMADAVRAGERRAAGAVTFLGLDYRSDEGEPATPAMLCYAEACNPEEFATFQIYEWQKRIRALLPGGRVVICRDSAPWNNEAGTLSWDCNGGPTGDLPIVVKLGWHAKNPDGSLVWQDSLGFPPSVALTVSTVSK